jgi:hypothetical protein
MFLDQKAIDRQNASLALSFRRGGWPIQECAEFSDRIIGRNNNIMQSCNLFMVHFIFKFRHPPQAKIWTGASG